MLRIVVCLLCLLFCMCFSWNNSRKESPKDSPKDSLYWLTQSAEEGHTEAQYQLALRLSDTSDIQKKSPKRSRQKINSKNFFAPFSPSKSCLTGNPVLFFTTGSSYVNIKNSEIEINGLSFGGEVRHPVHPFFDLAFSLTYLNEHLNNFALDQASSLSLTGHIILHPFTLSNRDSDDLIVPYISYGVSSHIITYSDDSGNYYDYRSGDLGDTLSFGIEYTLNRHSLSFTPYISQSCLYDEKSYQFGLQINTFQEKSITSCDISKIKNGISLQVKMGHRF